MFKVFVHFFNVTVRKCWCACSDRTWVKLHFSRAVFLCENYFWTRTHYIQGKIFPFRVKTSIIKTWREGWKQMNWEAVQTEKPDDETIKEATNAWRQHSWAFQSTLGPSRAFSDLPESSQIIQSIPGPSRAFPDCSADLARHCNLQTQLYSGDF